MNNLLTGIGVVQYIDATVVYSKCNVAIIVIRSGSICSFVVHCMVI